MPSRVLVAPAPLPMALTGNSPATPFGSSQATDAATASSPALFQTIVSSPFQPTNWPEASVPATNAADPAARTQPYSKPGFPWDEPSAMASANGVSGARTAAWATLTVSSSRKPRAGT